MRTTLDLDDAVLSAARSLAQATGLTLGQAVSELARRGLNPSHGRESITTHYSPFPVLVGDPDHPVTPELVAEFRDDA